MEQIVNGKEVAKFKPNDCEIVAAPLCLGNILKYRSVDNMKITGLNGYIYEFNVDYDPIFGDINKGMPTFHNYFMFKYGKK